MATIRIPESAEPLLPFCRTSGSNGPHIWETYADLITFLAALGYAQDVLLPEKVRPLKSANPIDLATFRSRGLYPQLLMLAIANQRDWLISKNPDEIADIAERHAETGALVVTADYDKHSAGTSIDALVESLKTRLQSTKSLSELRFPKI